MYQLLQRIRRFTKTPDGAAVLSFIFPGLGQAAAGRPSRGAIVAIPALAVIAALLIALLFARRSLFDNVFNDQWLFSLLVVDLLAMAYHLWAIGDAYATARRRKLRTMLPRKWMSVAAVMTLVGATVVVHGSIAAMDMTWRNAAACIGDETGRCIYEDQPLGPIDTSTTAPSIPVDDPGGSHDPGGATFTLAPAASLPYGQLPESQVTQNSANWAADGQLNMLLLGVDQGQSGSGSRSSGLRTDSMILLQVDLKSGKAAMYSIARNLYCIPMPKGIAEHYPNKSTPGNTFVCPPYTFPYDMLSGLWYEAAYRHPSYFPFYPGDENRYIRGIMALEQGIGALTGVQVDGSVVINLAGFVRLVDDLGGVDVNVPKKLVDHPCGPEGTWQHEHGNCASAYKQSGYDVGMGTASGVTIAKMKADGEATGKQSVTWSSGSYISFVIQPGQQHMSGDWALAYARSRHYDPEGDYGRMKRQQLVLQSVRDSVNPCLLLPSMNTIMGHMGQAFWTDMPLDSASQLVGIASYITGGNVAKFSLDPRTLKSPSGSTRIDGTGWALAKEIVAHGLEKAPAASPGGGGGGGGGGFGC